jgi:hypothetical protein
MALDSDPAGGFRTKDEGSFWFGSDANPTAVQMDTDGNADFDGDVSVGGGVTFAGAVTVSGGALVLADVDAAPDAPASGVILYSESGVLKCVDPTETVTQLAPPEA